MKDVLREALSSIAPTAHDREVLTDVKKFLTKLQQELRSRRINAKPVLGGSFAKDTWLRGDYDVDVFVAFDLSHKNDPLSDLLEKALKPWKTERLHGSRDYFQIHGPINYEIIPVLAIKNVKHALNVTDFSPKHVAWVNSKGKKLKNDIRLLKKFCKAHRVYGAESYIRGFSGHVVDILTIYYGGFQKVLKAATTWKDKTILDYNNTYKGKALFMLNTSKTQGPFVLIDPVQPDRNAAAALTKENFNAFIAAAKSFLKKPNIAAFTEKKTDIAALIKKKVPVVHITTLDDKEDIAGTKMVKAFEFIKHALTDFGVRDAGWDWDKKKHATCWFVLAKKDLPATEQRIGPPKDMLKSCADFKKKYKNAKLAKGRMVATVKRPITNYKIAINEALKHPYLKDKATTFRLQA